MRAHSIVQQGNRETPECAPAPAGEASFSCPSCATESVGKFCRNCGERKLGTDDRSLRHYFDIVANFLTQFDSKGYRSLWYLVAKAGFLTVEQLRGSRVRYAKPLSLFISINVVYYFSAALFGANTFTTPLSIQLDQNDYYAGFATRSVDERLKTTGMTYATVETRYNERAAVLSKTLIFLFIPIYAVVFFVLFFKRRRHFVDHVIVATHLWSYILLLLAIVVPAIAAVLLWWSKAPSIAAVFATNDNPISVFLQACIGVYMALMLRRVYDVPYWCCATVAVVIAWSFFHIVWLYRFFLFTITIHSL